MNTGTGWPFGGPDITLNHAATRAIFEQYSVTGGKEIVQDISINNPKEKKQREIATLNRLMAYNTEGICLDLTAKVKSGKLKWNAPKGEWKLIALFIGKTFQKVKRAAPGGEGYVMDHLNPEAVKDISLNSIRPSNKTRRPTRVHSSTIHMKSIKPTGVPTCWKNSNVEEDTSSKNTFLSFWIPHVRKQPAALYPTIVKPSAKC